MIGQTFSSSCAVAHEERQAGHRGERHGAGDEALVGLGELHLAVARDLDHLGGAERQLAGGPHDDVELAVGRLLHLFGEFLVAQRDRMGDAGHGVHVPLGRRLSGSAAAGGGGAEHTQHDRPPAKLHLHRHPPFALPVHGNDFMDRPSPLSLDCFYCSSASRTKRGKWGPSSRPQDLRGNDARLVGRLACDSPTAWPRNTGHRHSSRSSSALPWRRIMANFANCTICLCIVYVQ